ncbi:recombinase family protein [Oscillibacter sp.]|uniref:recombinase family protein n=1 Tax=Oscillibacter sp. TaxID=1945593 RepID=UPI0028AFF499|nr:recombinase family protein [Oscillibacter sp.]
MQTDRRLIAIYSRKSKFTGKGESIENQIELCRQYVRVHQDDDAANSVLIYEDEGFSGGNLERPKFKRMMADARDGKISTIVVYRLDRISRNIGDFAKLIEELKDLKVSFVSIREQFDTENPMGRAMMYIASVFSQLERETIAERIRDNMHELAKTGRWLGGVTPTGYASEQVQKVMVDGKVRKACKLKLIQAEADVIQVVFQIFLETNSLTKTDAFLLEQGYRTKNGKQFTRFAIRNILQNPVYMIADQDAYRYLKEHETDLFASEDDFDGIHGLMVYNRTIQKQGKANQLRPMQEWITSVGRHPGLIPGTQWIKAQQFLGQNRNKGYRKPRSNVALLSGLLYCGKCGDYMRPKLTNRQTADGETLYTYMCTMKERSRSHCCDVKNVNGNLLDQTILSEMKKLSEDHSAFIERLKAGRKALSGNREEYDLRLEQLAQEQRSKESEIKALVSSLTKAAGSAAEEYIVAQIDDLHKEVEQFKRHTEKLQQLTAGHELADLEFDIFQEMLSSFKNTIDSMTVEEKRVAIRTCLKKIVWDGEHIHLYLFGSEGEVDLPKLACRNEPLRENSK